MHLLPEPQRPRGAKLDDRVQRTLPLHYSRRDFANAGWKLGFPLLGPGMEKFWSSGQELYQAGIILFIGLQRALPGITPDDAHDLIPYDDERIQAATLAAVQAALPKPKEDAEAEDHAADAPLVPPTGGSAPGPLLVTTSA